MKFIVSVLVFAIFLFFVFILFKVFSWLYKVTKARYESWRSNRKNGGTKI